MGLLEIQMLDNMAGDTYSLELALKSPPPHLAWRAWRESKLLNFGVNFWQAPIYIKQNRQANKRTKWSHPKIYEKWRNLPFPQVIPASSEVGGNLSLLICFVLIIEQTRAAKWNNLSSNAHNECFFWLLENVERWTGPGHECIHGGTLRG